MPESTHRTSAGLTDKPAIDVEDWTRSVDAFTRMIDRLQSEYAELEARHTALNSELAAVNESLHAAAEGNRRLAAYRDQIVAGVSAGIIAVDRAGIVRLYNPAAESLLARKGADVLNRPYAEVWPERCEDSATAASCVAGAPEVENLRREFTRADGSTRILSVSTIRLRASGAGDTATDGAMEVFTDLTPLERLSAEMSRMRTLAALGEMSATVAHEIRNPLGGIIGFAELLARRTADDPQQSEMVAKIVTGAQHLNTLVERLLEFAREPKLDARPLEWTKFLTTTLDQYEENARRRGVKLTLTRKIPETLPAGRADGLCLRQAIWNILENAEHAAGNDGRVAFEVEANDPAHVHLRIVDDGPGIDPKVAERVFSPFVTTKKKGTGLGLATARKFVEAHGGSIQIERGARTGTSVTLALPTSVEEG